MHFHIRHSNCRLNLFLEVRTGGAFAWLRNLQVDRVGWSATPNTVRKPSGPRDHCVRRLTIKRNLHPPLSNVQAVPLQVGSPLSSKRGPDEVVLRRPKTETRSDHNFLPPPSVKLQIVPPQVGPELDCRVCGAFQLDEVVLWPYNIERQNQKPPCTMSNPKILWPISVKCTDCTTSRLEVIVPVTWIVVSAPQSRQKRTWTHSQEK